MCGQIADAHFAVCGNFFVLGEAFFLCLARSGDFFANFPCLTTPFLLFLKRRGQFFMFDASHRNPEVNAVHDGTGDLALIAQEIGGQTHAGLFASEIAARARVHRGDENELRGEYRASLRAGNRDLPVFKRLAQRFDDAPIELRELVEDGRFAKMPFP